MDSLLILEPKIRLEIPMIAVEADTGNPFLDLALVLGIVLVIYIGQKIARKSF
jgi:hypothetical protein